MVGVVGSSPIVPTKFQKGVSVQEIPFFISENFFLLQTFCRILVQFHPDENYHSFVRFSLFKFKVYYHFLTIEFIYF